jgi:hypothetical protein
MVSGFGCRVSVNCFDRYLTPGTCHLFYFTLRSRTIIFVVRLFLRVL